MAKDSKGKKPGRHRSNSPEDPACYEVSRRRFLSGLSASTLSAWALGGSVVAGSTILSACSSRAVVAPTLVPLFSPDHILVAGRPQRIPFATVANASTDADNAEIIFGPDGAEVPVQLIRDDQVVADTTAVGRIVDHDHVGADGEVEHEHANLFRYYPLRVEVDEPGIYDLVATFNQDGFQSVEATMPIQIFDPADARVLLVGDEFPIVATPTESDSTGVDTLCTRVDPCSFHSVSASELLGKGQAFALLVATPALCSTAYCGPVLETLIEAQASLDQKPPIVHVEVYANTSEVNGNFADPNIRLAPAVLDLGLEFEPSLFIVSSDGILLDRIDNLFDLSEATTALKLISN